MGLFFIGYLIAVASTIAFIVAILTPRWIYPNNLPVTNTSLASPSDTNYRGIFYVDAGYPNGTCRDWILLYSDSVATCRPRMLLKKYLYQMFSVFVLAYAVACASLSIIAASLSVILLWLAGSYLFVRRRRLAPNFVVLIALLTLLICK